MPRRADLLALPVADKLDIIEQLWDSLTAADKDELPLAEWQRQELDRRIDHLDDHPDETIPREDVRRRLRSDS
jgi:putative addiction module component (TIGR02574 family)